MIKKLSNFLKNIDLLLIIIAVTSLMLIGEHAGIIHFDSKKPSLAANNAGNRQPPENAQPGPQNNGQDKGAPEPPHGAPEQDNVIPKGPPMPITIEQIEKINFDNINDEVHPAQSYLIVADFLSAFNIDVSNIYKLDGEAQKMNKFHKYKEENEYLSKACHEARSLLDKHMNLAYKNYSAKNPQAAAAAGQFKTQAEQTPADKPHKALYYYVEGLKQFSNNNPKN